MFSHYSIVVNGLRHSKINEKTDEDLILEYEIQQQKLSDEMAVDPKNDPENFTGCRRMFLLVARFCHELAYGKYASLVFNPIIIAVIVMAGIVIGIESYPSMDGNPGLVVFDEIIMSAFIFEFAVKVVAEGVFPWKYFMGKEGLWNTFDFVVILLSIPFPASFFSNKAAPFRIATRLFRLVRLAKIVRKLPALQVIINGLIGGLQSISFIAMLLVLVYYLYAVMGVYFFRENDPFEFRSVLTAMIMLFRISTLESWSDSFKTNLYGCAVYNRGLYFQESDFPMSNGNITFSWDDVPSMFRCVNSQPSPVLSVIYFFSFTLLASLVMLSLFVGIITTSMQDAMDSMRREGEDNARRKALFQHAKEMERAQKLREAKLMRLSFMAGSTRHHESSSSFDLSPNTNVVSNIGGRATSNRSIEDGSGLDRKGPSDEAHSGGDVCKTTLARRLAHRAQSVFAPTTRRMSALHEKMKDTVKHTVTYALSARERKAVEQMEEMRALLAQAWCGSCVADDFHKDYMEDDNVGSVAKLLKKCATHAKTITESNYFTTGAAAMIIVASVLIGLEANLTPRELQNDNYMRPYVVMENLIYAFFVVELFLHMLAVEFDVIEYTSDRWNIFDFLVVIGSKMPSAGTEIVVLRLVRILRVLKLLKAFPELGVIVNALIMGVSSISYIAIMMVLSFYMFGILASTFFRQNDPFHFGRLHISMYSLFQIATLDNWGDIMFVNIYGCDVYPPRPTQTPRQLSFCTSPHAGGAWAAIFFIIFVVFGALVMLTLFVGVVTTSMDESQKHSLVEIDLEKRIDEVCESAKVGSDLLSVYRRVFKMLDLDGSGCISVNELQMCLAAVRIDADEIVIKEWVREVDINSDGEIDLVEFVLFMTNVRRRNMEKKLEAALNSSSIQPPVGMLRRTMDGRFPTMLKDPEGGSGSNSSSSGGGSGSGSDDDGNDEHDANKIRTKARKQSALQRFAKAVAAPLRRLLSIQMRGRSVVAGGADDVDAKNVADDQNTSDKRKRKTKKQKEKQKEKESSGRMRMSGVKTPDEPAQTSPQTAKRSTSSIKRQGSSVGLLAEALKDSAMKISDSITSTPESYKQKISFNKSKMKDQLIFADGTIKVVPRSSFHDDLDSTGGGRSRSSTADGNLTPFGRSRRHAPSFGTAQDLNQRYSTRQIDSEVDPTATFSRQDSVDSDMYQGRCRNTSLDSADFMPRSRNASMDSVLSSEDDKPVVVVGGGGGISVDSGSLTPTGRILSRSGSVAVLKSRSGSYEIAPEQMLSFREESISALKYIQLSRQCAGDISPLLSGWDERPPNASLQESDCSSVDGVLRLSQTSRKRRNSTLEIIGEDDGNDRSMKDDGNDDVEKDLSLSRSGRW